MEEEEEEAEVEVEREVVSNDRRDEKQEGDEHEGEELVNGSAVEKPQQERSLQVVLGSGEPDYKRYSPFIRSLFLSL